MLPVLYLTHCLYIIIITVNTVLDKLATSTVFSISWLEKLLLGITSMTCFDIVHEEREVVLEENHC